MKQIGNSCEEDEVLGALLLRERAEFAETAVEIPYIRAHLGAVLLNEMSTSLNHHLIRSCRWDSLLGRIVRYTLRIKVRLVKQPEPVEVMHCEMYNKFGWYHGSSTFRPSSRNIRVRTEGFLFYKLLYHFNHNYFNLTKKEEHL